MDSILYDVAIIGGGPAGLAAAISAHKEGASVILIEREARLGGILKQCIHDGFGLLRFEEKLSGSEYACRDIATLEAFKRDDTDVDIDISLQTFVTEIENMKASNIPGKDGFLLTLVSRQGLRKVHVNSLVLATGCRERTARQVAIHGTRPAGIYTAGTAQYYTNIMGQLPTRRCVILGSGDIGLIMARRLTLEGAQVIGVYEARPTPSGLLRNIAQCLNDFDIPLYTGHTVTRVFGQMRLEAVEISEVDEAMNPIPGTEERVSCDGLILSVGLIPENELAESLSVPICDDTKGPICDQDYMTLVDGVFSCGNAFHVNDLVDYVSQSGEIAGRAAARYAFVRHRSCPAVMRKFASITASEAFSYVVPQRVDINRISAESSDEGIHCFFRVKTERGRSDLSVFVDGQEIIRKSYKQLRPPEMEKIVIPFAGLSLNEDSTIVFEMENIEESVDR